MKFQGNPKGFFVCGFFHKIRLYYNDRSQKETEGATERGFGESLKEGLFSKVLLVIYGSQNTFDALLIIIA